MLDVGAGTGNYSYELANAGYKVTAVEPSETMRKQAKQHHNLTWLPGVAEELPAENHAFDGLICTLATHHFSNLALGFREMNRVVKPDGRIVIFSADPRICMDTCWISHSGRFQQQYGDIYGRTEYDCGYFFLVG